MPLVGKRCRCRPQSAITRICCCRAALARSGCSHRVLVRCTGRGRHPHLSPLRSRRAPRRRRPRLVAPPQTTSPPQPTSTARVLWGICGYPPKCDGALVEQESALGRTFAVAKTYQRVTTDSRSGTGTLSPRATRSSTRSARRSRRAAASRSRASSTSPRASTTNRSSPSCSRSTPFARRRNSISVASPRTRSRRAPAASQVTRRSAVPNTSPRSGTCTISPCSAGSRGCAGSGRSPRRRTASHRRLLTAGEENEGVSSGKELISASAVSLRTSARPPPYTVKPKRSSSTVPAPDVGAPDGPRVADAPGEGDADGDVLGAATRALPIPIAMTSTRRAAATTQKAGNGSERSAALA